MLASGALAGQIKDTKAARETQALADFMAMLAHDSSRAFYGPGHVQAAHEMGAIQVCGGGGGGCAAAAVVCGGRGSAAEWCGVGCCPLLPSASVRHPPSLWSCQCPSAPPLLSCLQTLLTTTSPLPLPFSYPSMFCPLPFALQTLLITDSLFRTTDLRRRKKCVALVDEVTAGAPP